MHTVHSKVWVSKPGGYQLAGWHAKIEVLEFAQEPEQIRHKYLYQPTVENISFITVYNSP
jgi:hypothetical protein